MANSHHFETKIVRYLPPIEPSWVGGPYIPIIQYSCTICGYCMTARGGAGEIFLLLEYAPPCSIDSKNKENA